MWFWRDKSRNLFRQRWQSIHLNWGRRQDWKCTGNVIRLWIWRQFEILSRNCHALMQPHAPSCKVRQRTTTWALCVIWPCNPRNPHLTPSLQCCMYFVKLANQRSETWRTQSCQRPIAAPMAVGLRGSTRLRSQLWRGLFRPTAVTVDQRPQNRLKWRRLLPAATLVKSDEGGKF